MPSIDLFIPTYNRPHLLKRLLTYYVEHGRWLNIFIVDSSSSQIKKINRETLLDLKSKNLTHITEFSSKKTNPHFIFGKMLKYSKAEYIVFCADDDFVIPNAIRSCVNFLKANPDYSVAHGTYLSFYVTKSNSFLWKFIYPFKSISSTNPQTRLSKHLTQYYQVLWAVRRASTVKLAYKNFLKARPDPYIFGELMPDMATLILGKMKRLPILYAFRQAASSLGGNWPTLTDSIRNGTYQKEYIKFKKGLSKLLITKAPISEKQALFDIDKDMETYLKNYAPEHYVLKAYAFISRFPKIFGQSLSALHLRYLFSKDKVDKITRVNPLGKRFAKDFEAVKDAVLSSVKD